MSTITGIRPRPSQIDPIQDLKRWFDNSGAKNGSLLDYWYKPGIPTAFGAYMRNTSGGSGFISSTRHATKGMIYLGSAQTSAFDETNERIGLEVAAPSAKLHMQVGAPVGQTPSMTAATESFGGGSAPVGAATLLECLNTVSDASYVRYTDFGFNSQVRCDWAAFTDPVVRTGFSIVARMKGYAGIDARVELVLINSAGGSQIVSAFWGVGSANTNISGDYQGNLTTGFVEYTYPLSAGQANLINFASDTLDLYIVSHSPLSSSGANYEVSYAKLVGPAVGGGSAETLQKWQTAIYSNSLDFGADGAGGSTLDLILSGDNPFRVNSGGGTSGLRFLTSSTNGRIEAGDSAAANMNLVLSGTRDTTGTQLTSKFANTTLTGTVTINGGSPAAGRILESTDANGLARWSTLATVGVAPSNASYITISSEAGLTDERVLTMGSDRVTKVDGGAGSTVTLDASMSSANWDWTRGLTITSTVDEIQLDITPKAAQTAAALRVLQQADLVRTFQVDASGTVTVSDTTHTDSIVRFQIRTPSTQATTIAQVIRAFAGGNYTAWSIGSTGANALGDTGTDGAAVVRMQINQGSGQSVDMFRARNTAGSVDFVKIDSAGVFSLSAPLLVSSGGSGAATLTGLLQGNGTGAFTGITNSSTVGQVLRVTGASTYAWGALDLADTDAITGLLPLANGGTGANYASNTAFFNAIDPLTTAGDILTHDGTNSIRFASVAAGSFLRAAGVATNVAWSTLVLPNAITSGAILYGSAANVAASSALLAANQLVLGGGAGVAPATLGSLGTTTTLLHGNAAGAPTFGAVSLTADVSGDLPFANLAQGSALSVLGVTGNSIADNASIVAASDHQVMRRSGTAVAFGAVNLAQAAAVTGLLGLTNGGTAASLTAAHGAVAYSTASALALSAAGSLGQLLRSAGAASPTWTTATFPATAGTLGNVLTSDGTNWSSAAPAGGTSFGTPAANSVTISAPSAGAASTAIRSDAGLQLSQAIIPEWTGDHTWVDVRPVIKGVAAGPLSLQWWNTAGGANISVFLSASPAGSTNVTAELTGAPGQVAITGNGSIPVSATARIGRINLTGQVANIASTNVTNVTGTSIATGKFLVTAALACTTAEALAANVILTITWTGDSGATSAPIISRSMIATGTTTGHVEAYLASGNISYAISGYTNPGGGVTPAFAIRIRVTYMGA